MFQFTNDQKSGHDCSFSRPANYFNLFGILLRSINDTIFQLNLCEDPKHLALENIYVPNFTKNQDAHGFAYLHTKNV